jgi:hypothetical protein
MNRGHDYASWLSKSEYRREKIVAVDINGVAAGTTLWGGKERDAEFALEANDFEERVQEKR